MPQKQLTSADHYIYHSVTQRYNIPSQLESIFISFTHNANTYHYHFQRTEFMKVEMLKKRPS